MLSVDFPVSAGHSIFCHQFSVTLNNVSFHSQWQNWCQRLGPCGQSLNHDHVAADADDDSTIGLGEKSKIKIKTCTLGF